MSNKTILTTVTLIAQAHKRIGDPGTIIKEQDEVPLLPSKKAFVPVEAYGHSPFWAVFYWEDNRWTGGRRLEPGWAERWYGITWPKPGKPLSQLKLCAWCKRDDFGDTEASALVRGVVWNDYLARGMPFKAWLCEMHQDDDYIVRSDILKSAEESVQPLVECPSCGGESVTWTITCHVCKNTGKVSQEEAEWQRRKS